MGPVVLYSSVFTVILGLAAPAEPRAAPDFQTPGAPRVSMGRVRPLDDVARRVLTLARTASPTVAQMIAELEASDLIVSVQTCPLPRLVEGDIRVVVAVGAVRHVRIRLAVPRTTSGLVIALAHELRHALELAAAHEIRSAADGPGVYAMRGATRVRQGYFETEAALETGRLVSEELIRLRPK